MRSGFAFLCFIGFLAAVSAQAETRTFLVASYSEGYGVDHCLASKDVCGNAVANSYCRSQAYLRAVSFRKIARRDVAATPEQELAGCRGGVCSDFIAIECFR